MKYFFSPSQDPFWNLGFEDWILRLGSFDEELLFIWSCFPSVILGRFQNPWMEANIPLLAGDGIFLVRRQSGGGCVYCDENNVNFTFFRKKGIRGKRENLDFINDFLLERGFDTFVGERGDIFLKRGKSSYKISGSAFKQTKDAGFHHCSLLVDSDLCKLRKFLSPALNSGKTRAVKSIRSPVTTLGKTIPGFTLDCFRDFFREYLEKKGVEEASLKPDHAFIESRRRGFKDWVWVIGETPAFEYRDKSSGVGFRSHKGMLQALWVQSETIPLEKAVPMDAGVTQDLFQKNFSVENFLSERIGFTLQLNKSL